MLLVHQVNYGFAIQMGDLVWNQLQVKIDCVYVLQRWCLTTGEKNKTKTTTTHVLLGKEITKTQNRLSFS